MSFSKVLSILLILVSTSLRAEILELAPGLTTNPDKFVLKMASCGPGIPGNECLMQCFNIDNQTTDYYYTCNLQATANFVEKINLTNGSVLYTGNTLTATDYRSVVVYPYQTVSICFNYGKEVVSSPSQPNALWVYQSSTITDSMASPNAGGCIGGTVGAPPSSATLTLE